MAIPGGIQDSLTDETPQCSHGAGSFFQNPVSSKRKRQCQDEDYYSRLCSIEEKKLEIMLDRIIGKKSDADREDEDLMFLKTLLPHIRKIPQHMKLRFQSRMQNVVEKFAYGPQSD